MKTLNINRLEKICNTKLNIFQEKAIYEWAKEFEDTVKSELDREYKYSYGRDLGQAVDFFIIAIAFVLHFGESTRFGRKRLGSVLRDIQETVDMFRRDEYKPKDYINMLKDEGIDIKIRF